MRACERCTPMRCTLIRCILCEMHAPIGLKCFGNPQTNDYVDAVKFEKRRVRKNLRCAENAAQPRVLHSTISEMRGRFGPKTWHKKGNFLRAALFLLSRPFGEILHLIRSNRRRQKLSMTVNSHDGRQLAGRD